MRTGLFRNPHKALVVLVIFIGFVKRKTAAAARAHTAQIQLDSTSKGFIIITKMRLKMLNTRHIEVHENRASVRETEK